MGVIDSNGIYEEVNRPDKLAASNACLKNKDCKGFSEENKNGGSQLCGEFTSQNSHLLGETYHKGSFAITLYY